ncbi:MAG TPA: hypothetical protein DIW54_01580, partial [Chitinophagaceae bacterium]|nr:hypothetical protein [Chitinophagaceae bacterium]
SGADLFEVRDAVRDDRFANNPLVTGTEQIGFYAGVPLINKNGFTMGTLCVMDRQPNQLNDEQIFALK